IPEPVRHPPEINDKPAGNEQRNPHASARPIEAPLGRDNGEEVKMPDALQRKRPDSDTPAAMRTEESFFPPAQFLAFDFDFALQSFQQRLILFADGIH